MSEFNLEIFVAAQAGSYASARAELAAGQKRTHWMWYIFPQLRGLGSSPMAQRFAIPGLSEATEYLAHPLLGTRLRECTELVNAVGGRSIGQIFGYPDDLKFHSWVTLFAQAAGDGAEGVGFREALDRYFNGTPDAATLKLLGR